MTETCIHCNRTVSKVDGKESNKGFICNICLNVTTPEAYREIANWLENIPTKELGLLNLYLAQELGLMIVELPEVKK